MMTRNRYLNNHSYLKKKKKLRTITEENVYGEKLRRASKVDHLCRSWRQMRICSSAIVVTRKMALTLADGFFERIIFN